MLTHKTTPVLTAETTACLGPAKGEKDRLPLSSLPTEGGGEEMGKTDGLNEHSIILSLASAWNIAYSI